MREHKGRKIELVEQQGGESNDSDGMEPKITRAAEYVRMSTEHQQYSTENQGDAIRAYAECHHMKIVRTYSDAGKSGLKIEGRDALCGHRDYRMLFRYTHLRAEDIVAKLDR